MEEADQFIRQLRRWLHRDNGFQFAGLLGNRAWPAEAGQDCIAAILRGHVPCILHISSNPHWAWDATAMPARTFLVSGGRPIAWPSADGKEKGRTAHPTVAKTTKEPFAELPGASSFRNSNHLFWNRVLVVDRLSKRPSQTERDSLPN
jgi:hypothetical protein